jgi:hypothetical protein
MSKARACVCDGAVVPCSVVHGIVSFSAGCGDPNFPGVYVDLAQEQHREWLLDMVSATEGWLDWLAHRLDAIAKACSCSTGRRLDDGTPSCELPEGDNVLDAVVVELPPSGKLSLALSTAGASRHPLEPELVASRGASASVWVAVAVPKDGSLAVDSLGSDFDTQLGAFQSRSSIGLSRSQYGDLVLQQANDNCGKGAAASTSCVTVKVRAHTQVYIVVDGVSGASGEVALNIHFLSST